MMTLSYEEEQFIADVRRELIRYEMTSNQVEAVVEQIREHLEASREHGEYGLEDLGSPDMYVRDYAEVQGLVRMQDAMDLESVPEKPPGQRSWRLGVWGFLKYSLVFAAVYIICQLLFSFALTTAWVKGYEITGFNLLYRISDQTWWNMMLIVFSLSISALVTILTHVFGKRRKHRDLLPFTEGGNVL
ncbi:hypothetical protein AK95_20015 [Paenibacillus sp. LC231]|uniref:hypothetical protein n=1 Tax=Paenibacillus sp. LC231 TaxID=1120679 RepID=UPI0008DE93AC|nr:hypothetical protein [Paenibacillus sp. LC231]OIA99464.1 hypothetical protein AK95_20015 [Paenibacillus sp. LC231]